MWVREKHEKEGAAHEMKLRVSSVHVETDQLPPFSCRPSLPALCGTITRAKQRAARRVRGGCFRQSGALLRGTSAAPILNPLHRPFRHSIGKREVRGGGGG